MPFSPKAARGLSWALASGFAVALLLNHAAASTPTAGAKAVSASVEFATLQRQLQRVPPDSRRFRQPGPFGVEMHAGYPMAVPPEQGGAEERAAALPKPAVPRDAGEQKPPDPVVTDLFLSRHADKAPLVMFMHGYGGSAETHHEQARHLASWGMHSLTLHLPNESEWAANGGTLARIVQLLSNPPEILRGRIDPDRIVLVGYSFGAISTAVALTRGTRATGAVLLDPAAPHPDIGDSLSAVRRPVMIIGADERIARAANRGLFFKALGGPVAELSVAGASHDDAQSLGDGDLTAKEVQATFTSVLTAAVFSLAATGRLNYAWRSLTSGLRDGKLFDARRK